MTYAEFERCTCICHSEEGVYHCMPCCHQCRHCGEHIQTCYIEEHEARCAGEREELGLPLNRYGFPGMSDLIMKQIDKQVVKALRKDEDEN